MPLDPTIAVLALAAAVVLLLLLVAVVPPWVGRRSPLLPRALRRTRGTGLEDWSTRLSDGPAVTARLMELRALEDRQSRIDAAREAYDRDPAEARGPRGSRGAQDTAARDPRDLIADRAADTAPASDPWGLGTRPAATLARESAFREAGEILEARQRAPRTAEPALVEARATEAATAAGSAQGLSALARDDQWETRLTEARERVRSTDPGRLDLRRMDAARAGGAGRDDDAGAARGGRATDTGRATDAGRGTDAGRDADGLNPLAVTATRINDSGELVPLDETRTPGAYDRIVRVVAMVFILAALTVTTISGVWPDVQGGITMVLVGAALGVLVVHDVLRPGRARSAVLVVESLVAVGIAAYLVAVTGRQASPFFLAFPLIVAGSALVVSARSAIALAVLGAGAYVAAVLVGTAGLPDAAVVSSVTLNITGLLLLTYVAIAIARMQRKSRDAAIRLSTIDAMTGLYNRPYLFTAIEGEIARSTRTGRGFCLLMMDMDELKGINDRYGHFVGDRALRAVADVIKFGVRRIDVPARYGGDEFVVLLPETDPTGGYVLGEKIRQGVSELQVPGTEVRTSMSVGMVAYPEDGRTADELMISADRAMYASKRLGKNRVMGAPSAAGGRADAPV